MLVLVLVAGAAVAAFVAQGGQGAEPAPDTAVPSAPDAAGPAVGNGDQLQRPLRSPDHHIDPVRCDGFSPEGRARLGRDGFVSEPVTRSSGERAMTCTFPGGSGVVVQTSTYPASPDGEGTASVWDRLERELPAAEGLAGIGDGALFSASPCRLWVAHSNVLLTLLGNLASDPEACRAELVALAEDFAAETFG